jgi:TatD DNase family protein
MILYDAHSHQTNDANTIALKNLELRLPFVFPAFKEDQYVSFGIHPWFTGKEQYKEQFEVLNLHLKETNVLAVGECGLDKAIDLDYDFQKEVFIKQIQLSEDYKKPLIVHAVRSYSDLLMIRQQVKTEQKWLVHDFNSSVEMARELIKSGCFLSIGKRVLKANDKFMKLVEYIPFEKLFIESDEDRLLLPEIYNNIASIKKIDLGYLIETQKSNFENFYKESFRTKQD